MVPVSSSISRSFFAPPIKVNKTFDLVGSRLWSIVVFWIWFWLNLDRPNYWKCFWSWLRLAQRLMFDLIFVDFLVVFAMDPDSFASPVYRNLNFEMLVEVWLRNLKICWRMKELSDHLKHESLQFVIRWVWIQIFMFWLQLVNHGRCWWHSTYCLWQWYWNG